MPWPGLLVAILAPWLVGTLVVRRLCPVGHPSLEAGYGYFFGMLIAGLALRLIDSAGLALSLTPALILVLLPGAVLLALGRKPVSRAPLADRWSTLDRAARAVVGFCIAYLALRYLQITLDVLCRPLYAWDAWTNWAPKAKVWFFERRLLDFVEPPVWLYAEPEAAVRTLVTARYPETVPLIQLWMALAVGRWDDLSINLPWLFCAVSLGLAFFGQLRTAGMHLLPSVLAAALLLTVPFLNVHTYLAGYGDIWMAAFLCLAAMALWNSVRRTDTGQARLFWLSTLACMTIKLPGLFLAGGLVLAWALARLPLRRLSSLLAIGALASILLLILGLDLQLPGIGRLFVTRETIELPLVGTYRFEFHNVWPAVAKNLFLLDNWHILWFALPAGLLLWPRLTYRARVATAALLVYAFTFVLGTFFFTDRYVDAINYSSLNRAVLYLAPLTLYWLTYLLLPWPTSDK